MCLATNQNNFQHNASLLCERCGGKTARLIEWDRKECFNTPGHGGHPKYSLEFPAFLLKHCVSFLSSVLIPTYPIQYFMSSLSNAFNIFDIWAFLQTALKFLHPLQFLTSLLQTQRRTQAFLNLAISLHRLGNVAHWQTVFVVGVGRWWSWVFFHVWWEKAQTVPLTRPEVERTIQLAD